jgi:ribonuclease D
MEQDDMIPYDYIGTDAELAALIRKLRGEKVTRLAIDVEGENNLHRYGIHVGLIQLFDGVRGSIVDPLANRDRSLLAALLENAPWTLVWFDAGNDLLSFQHAMGIRPSPILDLAIAARMLGRTGGLHQLTGEGGSASAKDRFQRSNWLRRPLSRALLDYAISDVLHLLELADKLMAELQGRGLAETFAARNLEQQNATRAWNPLPNFTRIPGYNRLPRPDRRHARILWYSRESYAREHDVPPGNVASKQDMGNILERGLHDAGGIARFLNKGRTRGIVDPVSYALHLAQAEKEVDAEDAGRSPLAGGVPTADRSY